MGSVSPGRAQVELVDDPDAEPLRVVKTADVDSLPVNGDSRRVGGSDAGENASQRALPGAVLSDERVDLAAPQSEARARQRTHAAVIFGDVVGSGGRR